jgi:hypothetical protein
MIAMSNDRSHGVLAAVSYLLRKQRDFDAITCLREWASRPARFPCLHGINLSMKLRFKNSLGNPLPSISL